jgi:photosystem II stability/assembly factor-like uncharacterized protein
MKGNNIQRFLTACFFMAICFILSNCKTPSSGFSKWQKLGPGGGGSTFIPTFSYHDTGHFLIRCDMTGSYLTRDGGDSYQQIDYPGGANCYAHDPVDSNTIYIGTSCLNKSADGGKTWQRIFPAANEIRSEVFTGDHAEYELKTIDTTVYNGKSEKVANIRVDPVQKGMIYFTIGTNFFYTLNNGNTWVKENLHQSLEYLYTNKDWLKNELYIFSSDKIFIFNKVAKTFGTKEIPKAMSPAFLFTAGTLKNSATTIFYALHHDVTKENPFVFVHSEVWSSVDNGVSWTQANDKTITNAASGLKPSITMITCAEYDAANVYLISNNYEEKKDDTTTLVWYGALKTGDAGTTWRWVWKGGGGSGQYRVQDANDAANLKDSWVHKAFGGEFIQLIDAGVSPQDGNVAIVTDWYRTMKTTDGGSTWREVYGKANADETYTSRGMDVTTTYGVHSDPFNREHIAISYTDIGLHQSFDNGKSWRRSVAGVPNEWTNTCYWLVYDPVIKNKVWSVWSGMHDIPRGKMTRNPQWKQSAIAKGGVCVSEDGGNTWQPAVNGMGDNSPATSIVMDPASPAGNRTLYVTVYNKGVFKSVDDGKTWQLKNKGIDSNTCAFELTMAGNGNLFLTVSPVPKHVDGKKGREFYSGAVYKSEDGAATWTKITVTDGLLFPNGIAIDPVNPDKIYLACWANISLADLVGGDVARSTGGDKMLNMPGGIFMSEDGGATWKSIFDKNQYVYDVTIDKYHAGRVYCVTFNQAAWRSDDNGKTWKKIKGYDFHWGHRIIVDEKDHEKIYISTYGSSVWHGIPAVE